MLGGDRFLIEIKTTASLQHPHILPLFDSGTVKGVITYSVYVTVLPVGGPIWKVSTGNVMSPVWTKNGRELVYLNTLVPDSAGVATSRVLAVAITPGPQLAAGLDGAGGSGAGRSEYVPRQSHAT